MILNKMIIAYATSGRKGFSKLLSDLIKIDIKTTTRTKSCSVHTCLNPVQRSKCTDSVQSMFCARSISLGHFNSLQLKDGVTHEKWDEEFWVRSSLRSVAKAKKGIKFESIHALDSVRTFSFALIKEGSKVTFTNDNELNSTILKSSDVVAASHILRPMPSIWVIENKYNTIEEWETGLQKHLSEVMSRNLLLTAAIDFLLNSLHDYIKMDKDIDVDTLHCTPLMESFLDYLFSEKNVEYCQRALFIYMKHCARYERYDLVSKAYGRAKKLVKIFGPDFMFNCQKFLLKTEHANDLLGFVDILREWTSFSPNLLSLVSIRAKLASGDLEEALGLLGNYFNEIVSQTYASDMDSVIEDMLAVFSYSEDPETWSRNKEVIEVLLTRMANAGIFPKEKAAKCIADWFTSIRNENWDYALVNSSKIRSRVCPFTKVVLQEKKMTDEEYDYLKRVILKEIIQEDSEVCKIAQTYTKINNLTPTYSGTHPNEVKSFLSMVYENGPFDLVVDGLNLVYYLGHRASARRLSRQDLMLMAEAWLRQYVTTREKRWARKMNVLVVTRQHLLFKAHGTFKDFATVWCTGNDSEDDPYFVYAALLSGRQCDLLTLDLMKDLAHKLGVKTNYLTSQLIYKWQQIHQSLMTTPSARSKKRQTFDVSIQRTANTWHIPYYHEGKFGPIPEQWLCLRKF